MALRYAYHARVPMVVLTGETVAYGEGGGPRVGEHWQRSQSDAGGPATLAGPFMKRSMRVSAPEVLLGMLFDACHSAMSPPQGPVLLSIPQEFLRVDLGDVTFAGSSSWTSYADPTAVARAADILRTAERPIIVTQSAGRRPQDVRALMRLAESYAIAVFDGSSPGFVNIPSDHPLFQGSVSQTDLESADVVLAIACPVPWFPAMSKPGSVRELVMIDWHPTYDNLPYWGVPVGQCLAGDIAMSMEALTADLARGPQADRGASERVASRMARLAEQHRARDLRREADLAAAKETWPIDTKWLTATLASLMPDDAILLEEVTTDKANVLEFAPRRHPGTYFGRTSGGLGLIMGMAQGIKLAAPDKLVVQILGDGGFHYSPALAAFGFASDYDCPTLMVICNNGSYASMAEAHLRSFPDGWSKRNGLRSIRIPPPAYADIARAYGGWAQRVDGPEALGSVLGDAIDQVLAGTPALVDVPTTPGKRGGRGRPA